MKKIELALHEDFNTVNELRNAIAEICRRLEFNKQDIYHIKSAVDEAFINIIQHSYKNKTGDVKIELDADDKKVTIRITDWGEPLDKTHLKRCSLSDIISEQKEHGLGLLMIERLMDKVKYMRRKKTNTLVMVKYRKEKLHERSRRT